VVREEARRDGRRSTGSLLPYCICDDETGGLALPLGWDELDTLRNGDVTAATFAAYLAVHGDAFARERERIGAQSFGDRALTRADARSRIERCARRTGAVAEGLYHRRRARGPRRRRGARCRRHSRAGAGTRPATRIDVAEVRLYGTARIRRTDARRGPRARVRASRRQRTFRLNRPADAWPAVALPALPAWRTPAEIDAAIATLRATATGGDPAAFEIAVCAAFALLGYLAQHVGGNGRPDGILTAPLGRAGYRAIIECKTASPGEIVANPRPEEPAKFRADANATHALLIGPVFGNDASFDDELLQHEVACWTVDDLATALRAQAAVEGRELRIAQACRTGGLEAFEDPETARPRGSVR